MSKKASSMITCSLIADCWSLTDDRNSVTAERANMVDQENSIVIEQKSITEDENPMIDGRYAIIALIT